MRCSVCQSPWVMGSWGFVKAQKGKKTIRLWTQSHQVSVVELDIDTARAILLPVREF